MRQRRFRVDHLQGRTPATITVSGDEAHHALHVLRLDVGDQVVLFDGHGREMEGRIQHVFPSHFEVERIGRILVDESLRRPLILAAAVPKGQRADWMVEKCAELGVRALWLLQTERGVVIPGEGKLSRWRRKAAEAAKQAGLSRMMEVEPPRPLASALLEIEPDASIFYGDPEHTSPFMLDRASGTEPNRAMVIFIGPEGGFTNRERAIIRDHGGRPMRLADSILRVETAAIAAASIWAYRTDSNKNKTA